VQADAGIAKLKEKVDTLIVVPNDRLLSVVDARETVMDAFGRADEVLFSGVSGISDLITNPGLINTDFADVKMTLQNAGSALMGIGTASGDSRARDAALKALSSNLLEASIEGARGVLLNVTGPSTMTLMEMNEAAEIIHGIAHQDANIIFGTVINDDMGDEVQVTVIAAGFDRWEGAPQVRPTGRPTGRSATPQREARPAPAPKDIFASDPAGPVDDGDDDFDVPSFLK
jgi:cell division protein FtsZ